MTELRMTAPTRSKPKWLTVAAMSAVLHAPPTAATSPDVANAIAVLRAQDEALLRIGERLVVSGRDYCGESGRSAGMTIQLRSQYGADYRAAAVAALGVGDLPTVTAIASDSAASAAGLAIGDQIDKIDGHRFVPTPPRRTSGDFAPTAAALDVIERALVDGIAHISIIRHDKEFALTLRPKAACRARFDVRAGRSANASSDGINVQVSSDLVADTNGDAELAAVLAHELAHNILRHPQRLKGPAPHPSVKQTEIEADRLSVYLLEAAGFGTAGAESFWGRWGRAHDWGIFAAGTHPSWKQRVAIIQAEAERIATLKQAGRPLVAPSDLVPRS